MEPEKKFPAVCFLCRYHRSGDFHHPMYSGIPDPLHVPSQRHLPHQWGKRQRGVCRGIGRHGHHWHWQPWNHWWIKERVVHLTTNVRTLKEDMTRQTTIQLRWRRFNAMTNKRRDTEMNNNLPEGAGLWGRHVQKSLFSLFVLGFLYIPKYIYIYIQSNRKRGGTVMQWSAAVRDCTCILTGLSFFVLCLGVFRSPLNTVYDK